ncbi:MAG: hypothetical protein WBD09_05625 [Halobacteriota archaeon]
MIMEMVLLSALAGVAVLFALGVLLSKDNFYSSLFMSAALIFVASVYALFNLQPVFVLIVFIFVGAIGIVTVALAATYRSDPERQFSGLWAVPVVITAFIIGFSIYSYNLLNPNVPSSVIEFELINFIPITEPITEYLVLILSLMSLVILLLLSVLKMGVGGTEN